MSGLGIVPKFKYFKSPNGHVVVRENINRKVIAYTTASRTLNPPIIVTPDIHSVVLFASEFIFRY